MHLHFTLPYRTRWGEQIKAVLHVSGLGKPSRQRLLPLRTLDGMTWQADLELALPPGAELIYHYQVHEEGRVKRSEWRAVPRKLLAGKSPVSHYDLHDFWRDAPDLAPLYSTAYTCARPAHDYLALPDETFEQTYILRASAPQVQPGETLYLTGSVAALGQWAPARAVPLRKSALHEWSVSLNAAEVPAGTEFKFLICSAHQAPLWEVGENHRLNLPVVPAGHAGVLSDLRPVFARTPWKMAGTVLPVFSLRSEGGFGVGDFGDIKRLVDWAVQTGQKVLQILPINDTTLTGTWTDSYPYNAVSVYALHPMYVNLRALPPLKEEAASKRLEQERVRLNALPQVDYEAVNKAKREYLRLSFAQDGARVLSSAEFKQFFERNQRWLLPYAAFSYLRDRFGTPDFTRWPRFGVYDPGQIKTLCAPSGAAYGPVSFYYYIQYILHKQLVAATRYGREKGVLLKGDIPIGVSRFSADAWAEPRLFHLDAQAGAPPDPFSATGQNWGLPTYNWEAMAQDGYSWWTRRFTKMAEYFDAYRVDHVLGFFRIWEIPMHSVQGLLGQFAPALAMDREEIERWGVPWQEAYLKPRISEELLTQLFGAQKEEVCQEFLQHMPEGWQFKPAYDTQRKVQQFFAQATDAQNLQIRDGLYSLLNQVLFVPDHRRAGQYHPRIAVLGEAVFKALPAPLQAAFTRLYNHYFYERNNDFWAQEALKKLPALTQSTRMLPCAEDLGMIPACVPGVLEQLKMLTLEIQRMPKTPGQTFADPAQYPWRSVCSISTHDMNPLRAWWEEDPALTQDFYQRVLQRPGPAPQQAPADVCRQVVQMHLNSPSLLCALSFQDWSSLDEDLRVADVQSERINVPAHPQHYWRYRMPLSLEALKSKDFFNRTLREMIAQSGR